MSINKVQFSKSIFYSYQTFIFDFDGTLVFSNDIKRGGFYHCAKNYKNGKKILKEFFNKNDRFDRYTVFKYLAENVSLDDNEVYQTYQKLLKDYKLYTNKKIINLPAIKGSLELLNQLKNQKKKIYINSATPKDSLLLILNERNLTHYFESVLGLEKSKIENLKFIQKHSKSEKKFMISIGDGIDDFKASNDFKIKFYPVGSFLTNKPTDYSALI